MGRPTRTRRLSITAIASLLAFGVVAALGVRSLRIVDSLNIDPSLAVGTSSGCVFYWRGIVDVVDSDYPNFNSSAIGPFTPGDIFKFEYSESDGPLLYGFRIPLWPLLLLLLIAPVRWLMARPANAPAFPVITDAKQA